MLLTYIHPLADRARTLVFEMQSPYHEAYPRRSDWTTFRGGCYSHVFGAQRRPYALKVIAFTKFMLSISGLKDEKIAWWLPNSKVTLQNLIMSALGRL